MPCCASQSAFLACDQGKSGNILGLASASANLGQEKIDTKGSVLIGEEALELVDLLLEHLWGVSNATNDTETTGIGDGGGKAGTRGDVHACEEDGVFDAEQVGDGSANLLCFVMAVVSIMLCTGLRKS